MTWIQTFTGRRFDLLNPLPEQVSFDDIAHHLARTARFNGATRDFYSVAQHSCLVSDLLPPKLKLVGLLHDATEAYVGDWTRPLKISMRQLGSDAADVINDRVAAAIGAALGVELVTLPEAVKHADNVMLATERRDLMSAVPEPWDWPPEPSPWRVKAWSPEQAEDVMRRRFTELTAGRSK